MLLHSIGIVLSFLSLHKLIKNVVWKWKPNTILFQIKETFRHLTSFLLVVTCWYGQPIVWLTLKMSDSYHSESSESSEGKWGRDWGRDWWRQWWWRQWWWRQWWCSTRSQQHPELFLKRRLGSQLDEEEKKVSHCGSKLSSHFVNYLKANFFFNFEPEYLKFQTISLEYEADSSPCGGLRSPLSSRYVPYSFLLPKNQPSFN